MDFIDTVAIGVSFHALNSSVWLGGFGGFSCLGQFVAGQQFFCFAVCLVTALRPILLRRLLRSLRGLSGATGGGGVGVCTNGAHKATPPAVAANALSQLSQVKLEFFIFIGILLLLIMYAFRMAIVS